MSKSPNYQNNPLHGVGLEQLLTEMVGYYGFEILFAYLNLNCFKINPSIKSSVKFLKKTNWAREKVEGFYMYQYKNLPRASADQFELPPRERIVPAHQKTGDPRPLSLEDAQRLKEKRSKKAAARGKGTQNIRYKDTNTADGSGWKMNRETVPALLEQIAESLHQLKELKKSAAVADKCPTSESNKSENNFLPHFDAFLDSLQTFQPFLNAALREAVESFEDKGTLVAEAFENGAINAFEAYDEQLTLQEELYQAVRNFV